jgi:hypothetical protein
MVSSDISLACFRFRGFHVEWNASSEGSELQPNKSTINPYKSTSASID